MSERWEPITADQYDAIPGKEGGGMMGSVFKYQGNQIAARRSYDEYAPGPVVWRYYQAINPEPNMLAPEQQEALRRWADKRLNEADPKEPTS